MSNPPSPGSSTTTELRLLQDEVSRLKATNQRLEFEKLQQNQKLEAAESARKILEGQVQLLFEQAAARPRNGELDDGTLDSGGDARIIKSRVSVDREVIKWSCDAAKSETAEYAVPLTFRSIPSSPVPEKPAPPQVLSPPRQPLHTIDDEALAPADEMYVDTQLMVGARTPLDTKEIEDVVVREARRPFTTQESDDSTKAAFLGKLAFRNVIQVNHAVMMLDPDTFYSILGYLGDPTFPIDVPTSLTSQHVSRETIANKFGGNTHGLLQRPADSAIRAHGYSHFLCPQLETHPHAPQVVGAHGLILHCGLEDGIYGSEDERRMQGSESHKIIVGISSDQWLYTGEYELERGDPLTPDQWSSFSWKVRDAWTKAILAGKTAIRAETRAAIALRKHLGYEPSREEIKDAVKSKDLIWESVKKSDVVSAYDNGEERVVPWVMKCVGYDEDFQRKLLDGEIYKRPPKRTSNGNIGGSSRKRTKHSVLEDWALYM